MIDAKIENHETFGLVGFSRITLGGGGVRLFGSSIDHDHCIALRVYRAKKHRSLSKDWILSKNVPIVEVLLSPTQFAEAITSFSIGDGVPCTIRSINGERMGDVPSNNKREEFDNEFEESTTKVAAYVDGALDTANSMLGGKRGKSEMKGLIRELEMLKQQIESNLPFVKDQFDTQMDRTVMEAKGEIDATVQTAISKLGVKSLKDIVAIGNHQQVPKIEP
jgi:hypothetical protein